MLNKVLLIGHLGHDPSLRNTNTGTAVTSFSLATAETSKDRRGLRQKRTEWHAIVAWGKQAEIAKQYLKKGSLVYVEGRLQSREWQDKKGEKKKSTEVICEAMRILGEKPEAVAASVAKDAAPFVASDADIPF